MAGLLDEEDMRIAEGEVYLDPQSLEHYDHEATTYPAGENNSEAKRTRPLAYKAKLLYKGDGAPIGEFKTSGTRVCTRILFDERPHWSSSIRVEIKAFLAKGSTAADRPPEEGLIHKCVFRFNVASDRSKISTKVYVQ